MKVATDMASMLEACQGSSPWRLSILETSWSIRRNVQWFMILGSHIAKTVSSMSSTFGSLTICMPNIWMRRKKELHLVNDVQRPRFRLLSLQRCCPWLAIPAMAGVGPWNEQKVV